MNYTEFPFFVVRFPQLSFNRNLLADLNKELLLELIENHEIQEAIYLASPVLYNELNKISTKEYDAKKTTQIFYSIEKYVKRMMTRCTPFGLFAGFATGKINEETKITTANSYNRKTRLDMLFLCTLYDLIVQYPEINNKIKFYPNTTIYSLGKNYRFIECISKNSKIIYQITGIKKNSYLNNLLKISKYGATKNTLIEFLKNKDIDPDDAENYITDLINSQFLVSELNHSIMGPDYFERIIKSMENIGIPNNKIINTLKDISKLLIELDHNKFENYQKIISQIKTLQVDYNEKYLFQVDISHKVKECHLGKDIIKELKRSLSFLNKITRAVQNEDLVNFKKEFYNRYENREVALSEALDPEIGIGYPIKRDHGDTSPLIDDMVLPVKDDLRPMYEKLTKLQKHVCEEAIKCKINNKLEIVLTDNDVEDLSENWNDIPPTIYAFFQVLNHNSTDILINLKGAGGSSAANLLTRFSHLEEEINEYVKQITQKEQELLPDKIIAEIVHLPESRVGNILIRPHIREYEILYMANSDIKPNKQIKINDLTISIKNNNLYLRSKKLDKEIIPRLTNAHNYHKGLPIYKFLCDMQNQANRPSLYFDWGSYDYDFFPRIKYNNTIITLATWKFANEDVKFLYTINKDEKIITKVTNWRKKYNIPQYVVSVENDNELYIDFENIFSIKSLFSSIKNIPVITLKEFLFKPENAVIKDEDNNPYVNEYIVTFHKNP